MEFEIGSVIKMKAASMWRKSLGNPACGNGFPVEMPGMWAPGDGSTESGREKF